MTSMRFFAALIVVIDHVARGIAPAPFVTDLFVVGNVGVSFFFVLSGFVLMWTWRPGGSDRAFFRNRFARIAPLHVLTWVSAGAALVVAGGTVDPGVAILTLLLLQAWVPIVDYYFGMNGPSWSLSCEAFFYAVMPAIARRLLPSTGRRLLATLIGAFGFAVVASFVGHLLLRGAFSVGLFYVNPLYRLWEFVVGLALAVAVRRGFRVPVQVPVAAGVTAVAYLAVAALNAGIEHRVGVLGAVPMVALPSDLASILMTPCFALLIVSAAGVEADGRTLPISAGYLVRLGQWSFALYVSHMTVVLLVQAAVPPATPLRLRAPIAIGTVLAAVCISGVLHRFVETPLQSLLRSRSPASPPVPAT